MPELLAAYVTPNDPTVIEPFFNFRLVFLLCDRRRNHPEKSLHSVRVF